MVVGSVVISDLLPLVVIIVVVLGLLVGGEDAVALEIVAVFVIKAANKSVAESLSLVDFAVAGCAVVEIIVVVSIIVRLFAASSFSKDDVDLVFIVFSAKVVESGLLKTRAAVGSWSTPVVNGVVVVELVSVVESSCSLNVKSVDASTS